MSEDNKNGSFQFNVINFVRNLAAKAITRSFITSIQILEEIRNDGRMNEAEFQTCRKKVLDAGNAAIRDVEEIFEQFDIKIKGTK